MMYRIAWLSLLVFLPNCSSSGSTDTAPPPSTLPTIAALVQTTATDPQHPEFTILLAALKAADPTFVPAFNQGWRRATVFAPTDAAFTAAFAALNVTPAEVLSNRALLNTIIAYHVVPCVQFSSAELRANNGGIVTTLLEDHTHVLSVKNGNLMVDSATVTTPDVPASNGVVHIIDQVLFPADAMTIAGGLASFPIPDLTQVEPNSLADQFDSDNLATPVPAFIVFNAGARTAELGIPTHDSAGNLILVPLYERFMNQGLYTVFAPTDAAFEGAGIASTAFAADVNNATLLHHHMLPGVIHTATLVKLAGTAGTRVLTMAGDTIEFTTSGGSLQVGGAAVSSPDLQVGNGLLNTIDHVLQ